jgi:tRNA-splicing ligase RtcB
MVGIPPHRRISRWVVEIPASARPDMRVAARVYADEILWSSIADGRTLGQLVNVSTLPGIVPYACAMPDAHEGYGFPVGGVAAFRASDGIISPGGVGYDINCGVRLLASRVLARDCRDQIEPIVHDLSRSIPSGAGRGGRLHLSSYDLDDVLLRGAQALEDRDLASADDLVHTEAGGRLPSADPGDVSDRAKSRGINQLGTLGSGNHFVEVQRVETIHDEEAARALGLVPDLLTVLIHTGSRGLGHQVCTDYVRLMDRVMPRYGIVLPDRQLACAPFSSEEGQSYYRAMCAAANFAFANRQAITAQVRRVFDRALAGEGSLSVVYDVAHNMAKLEEHGDESLVVHRKGATRAFGPSHPETPPAYRAVGQPVFIPGSMGTASYVLVGTDASMAESFGSTCHGAGRTMSRRQAKRTKPGGEVRRELRERGIIVRVPGNAELAEEAPYAYKDVDRVVEVVEQAGLARRVARLTPLGVLKG